MEIVNFLPWGKVLFLCCFCCLAILTSWFLTFSSEYSTFFFYRYFLFYLVLFLSFQSLPFLDCCVSLKKLFFPALSFSSSILTAQPFALTYCLTIFLLSFLHSNCHKNSGNNVSKIATSYHFGNSLTINNGLFFLTTGYYHWF